MKAKSTPAQWLVGTWRSDKEKTIAGWGSYPPGSSDFQKILLRDLGKLEKRFTAQQFFTSFEGLKTRGRYEVIWEARNELVLTSGRKDSQEASHLRFVDPTTYWIHAGRYLEYFTKVR